MTETIQSRAYVNVTDKQWRKIFGVPPYTKSKTQTIVTTPDGNAFSTEKGNFKPKPVGKPILPPEPRK